jgi:hypothetical protein
VLFLGLQGTRLTGRLFGKAGPLPASDQISRELRNFSTSAPLPFDCIVDQLIFKSSLGKGLIHWQPDTAALVFETFRGREATVVFGKID